METRANDHSEQRCSQDGAVLDNCTIWSHGRTDVETRANLISASLDLAKACKAVLDRCKGSIYTTDQVTGETFDTLLRAALTKAGCL